jgi:hypothetical protein
MITAISGSMIHPIHLPTERAVRSRPTDTFSKKSISPQSFLEARRRIGDSPASYRFFYEENGDMNAAVPSIGGAIIVAQDVKAYFR